LKGTSDEALRVALAAPQQLLEKGKEEEEVEEEEREKEKEMEEEGKTEEEEEKKEPRLDPILLLVCALKL